MNDRPPASGADERQEIDELHRKLGQLNHYDLLGVDRSASADLVTHAHRARVARFTPSSFSMPLTNAYMQRLEAIAEALDVAYAVLSDPVRRYLYDQELGLKTRGADAKPATETKTPPTPGVTRRTPPHGTSPLELRPPAYTPPSPPQPITPVTPPKGPQFSPTDPLGPLDSSAQTPPASSFTQGPRAPAKQTGPQQAVSARVAEISRAITPPHGTPPNAALSGRASSTLPPPDNRVQALEAQVQALQTEVATLLAEIERLAVSVQLAIAHGLEPESAKPEQLIAAGQALVSSRVAVVSLLARREEGAGRWEVAANLWQRASRARPGDVMLLVNAANCLRKAGGDLTVAEALARQAIDLDPDSPDAHAALAVIESKRKQTP